MHLTEQQLSAGTGSRTVRACSGLCRRCLKNDPLSRRDASEAVSIALTSSMRRQRTRGARSSLTWRTGANLASSTYDCIICLQTLLLLLIYDIKAAIGTALVTVPVISQICRPDLDSWGDYWRFTHAVGATAVRGGLRARERHR
jgi:hypothetical protein